MKLNANDYNHYYDELELNILAVMKNKIINVFMKYFNDNNCDDYVITGIDFSANYHFNNNNNALIKHINYITNDISNIIHNINAVNAVDTKINDKNIGNSDDIIKHDITTQIYNKSIILCDIIYIGKSKQVLEYSDIPKQIKCYDIKCNTKEITLRHMHNTKNIINHVNNLAKKDKQLICDHFLTNDYIIININRKFILLTKIMLFIKEIIRKTHIQKKYYDAINIKFNICNIMKSVIYNSHEIYNRVLFLDLNILILPYYFGIIFNKYSEHEYLLQSYIDNNNYIIKISKTKSEGMVYMLKYGVKTCIYINDSIEFIHL
jgi:hypothetical protein